MIYEGVLEMSVFRAYDIRGVYPTEINEDIAYGVGRAFVLFLKCKTVVIGRDMRLSSDSIFEALARGITDQGADVIDIGLCSTPMDYFTIAKYGYDSGIMITASHNPKEYNGLKLSRAKAIPIGGDSGMKDVEALYNKHKGGSWPDAENKGTIIKKDIEDDYVAHLLDFMGGKKLSNMKIAVDAANATGVIEFEHMKKLSDDTVEYIPLYMEIDGTFPNHEANPLKEENMKDVAKAVVDNKAHIGLAFDGDCDRAGFVDEDGKVVSADFITALIARQFLLEKKGEKVLYDLRCSWVTKEEIEKAGGIPMMCKVGHAFIKRQLRDENAVFGGELAGHFYFRDNFFTDSGIIAILQMLKYVSSAIKGGTTVSQLVDPMRKYFCTGEINTKVKDPDAILKDLEDNFTEGASLVSHLDGIKVEFDDYWYNVRKSNTEPVLRLIVEGRTKEVMEQRRDELLNVIRG